MILSPALTWAAYIGGFGLVLCSTAAIADLWLARTQAREERAQLSKERESSGVDGQ